VKKIFSWIWGEISKSYESAKKFVVQALGIFKDKNGKVSSKRIAAYALILLSLRVSHFGSFVILLGAGVLLLIFAAITGT
jgi:hypothetical protein